MATIITSSRLAYFVCVNPVIIKLKGCIRAHDRKLGIQETLPNYQIQYR